jgi:hypothetical protein
MLRQVTFYLLTIVAAGPLLYSGWLHAAQPFHFARDIAGYGLLPEFAISPIVFVLPYMQLTLGAALFALKSRSEPRIMTAILFSLFIIFQTYALTTGKKIPCGCFGAESEGVSLKTAAVPTICLVATLVCLRLNREASLSTIANE